jgi:hypothetical protein
VFAQVLSKERKKEVAGSLKSKVLC